MGNFCANTKSLRAPFSRLDSCETVDPKRNTYYESGSHPATNHHYFMGTSTDMDLLAFPNEILLTIAESIEDSKDYYSFLRTNLRLANLLIPYLYRRALRYKNSVNALCWAAAMGNECMVRWLVEKRAFVQHGEVRETENPMETLIQNILLRGANLTVSDGYRLGTTRVFEPSLRHALIRRSRILTLKLLEMGADVKAKDKRGNTALHAVAEFGADEDITRKLIHLKADVNARNALGRTPLHCIKYGRGRVPTTKILLEHGADTMIKNSIGENVIQALMGARGTLISSAGHSGIYTPYPDGLRQHIRLLLVNGSTAFKDRTGNTGLHLAAATNDAELAEVLLHREVDADAQDDDGVTALHLAVNYGFSGIARMLIEAGADPDIQDNAGMAAINLASAAGHTGVLRLLLWKGADLDIQDKFGCAALHWAAQLGDSEMLMILLGGGADHTVREWRGRTPLLHAVRCGRMNAVKILIEEEDGITAERYRSSGMLDTGKLSNDYDPEKSSELLLDTSVTYNLQDVDEETIWETFSREFWESIEDLGGAK